MATDLNTLVEKMADAHDAYRAADRPGVVARKATKALVTKARIVGKAKAEGYSLDVAEGLLNRGEGRAAERAAIIHGATATDTPTTPTARIKSDGSRDRRIDAQRRKIGREAEQTARFWEADKGDTTDAGKQDEFDWS